MPLIEKDSEESDDENNNKPLTCGNLIKLIPRTSYLIFNLMAVYFFEYVIIMSFANAMDVRMKNKYPELIDTVRIQNFYVILNVCYQIGVFISRSSLSFIRIRKIWTLTAF